MGDGVPTTIRVLAVWAFIWGFGIRTSYAEAPQKWYFMALFSFQDADATPSATHTFATFFEAKENSTAQDGYELNDFTISFLPKDGSIVPARLASQDGINYDNLEDTFAIAKQKHLERKVVKWGPYQIQEELFRRAKEKVTLWKPHPPRYVVFDLNRRPQETDCIHAVSDLDGELKTGDSRGYEATRKVVRHFTRFLIQPGKVYNWVTERVGVSDTHKKQFPKWITKYWVETRDF